MKYLLAVLLLAIYPPAGLAATPPTVVADPDEWAGKVVELVRELDYEGLQAHLAGALDGKIFLLIHDTPP